MQTVAQLYTSTGYPTATLAADPSIVLIENSQNYFGVLIADSCYQTELAPSLILERVIWFRAARRRFYWTRFEQTVLTSEQGVYAARLNVNGPVIPNMSSIPYKMFFMSFDEHHALIEGLEQGKGSSIFGWSQSHFGTLPGFDATADYLKSPANYASISDFPDGIDFGTTRFVGVSVG